ncbi:MAG: PfkB family carbohydrate kinase [Promethearchaeota archaeon]|jgi:sugar/nucleoside kinase (ribokinase family)
MSNLDKNIFSIFLIGHFAIDNIIRFKHLSNPSLGGSVSYSSLALCKYTDDVKISIISHIGKSNFKESLLDILIKKNIDLKGIKYSEVRNTNFVLDYNNNSRNLTLKSKSPDLKFKDIPHEYLENVPNIIILAPLCNEISFDYVSQLLKKFPDVYIGIDLQGFLRKIDESGNVSYTYDDEVISHISKLISLIGSKLILKGSEEEIKLLANSHTDDYKTMNPFVKYNTEGIFIMTLGEKGSLIYKRGRDILEVPAFKPKKVVDETGAGDVYLSIFLYEYLNSDKSWEQIENSAYLASAAASFLIEKKGPTGFAIKKKVIKRINKKDYII